MLKIIKNTIFTIKFKETKAEMDGNSMIGNNKVTNQISSIKGTNQT